MIISQVCSDCGGNEVTTTAEVPAADRDKFLIFVQEVQRSYLKRGSSDSAALFIPPSSYKNQPLVIIGPQEDPCIHCKIAKDNITPLSTCPVSNTCLAFMYSQWCKLGQRVTESTMTFDSDVKNV